MRIQEHGVALFAGVILYSVLFTVVQGQAPPCPTLSASRTAELEGAFGQSILGCNITQDQAMTATSRLHWLIPEGGQAIIDFEDSVVRGVLQDAGARPGQVSSVIKALNNGNMSLEETGLLTVGTGCLMEIEPDLVTFFMATSEDAAEFNAAMGAECESRGFDMNASARNTLPQSILVDRIVSITVYVTISVACGVTKTQIEIIVDTVPDVLFFVDCPGTVIV